MSKQDVSTMRNAYEAFTAPTSPRSWRPSTRRSSGVSRVAGRSPGHLSWGGERCERCLRKGSGALR